MTKIEPKPYSFKMGIYGFSSSDDDAEYTPPNDDQEVDRDGDRYVRESGWMLYE